MGNISTSPRYVIDITGTGPLSLRELGGKVNSNKLKKEVFLTYSEVIRS